MSIRSSRTRRTAFATLAAALGLAAAAVVPTATASADEARRSNPATRTAGAPSYLHFGPWGGLCTRSFKSTVEDREIVLSHGVLYINGDNSDETSVELSIDNQGTSSKWDDELVVLLEVLTDGADFETTFTTPYWKPSSTGSIGGWTTENTPKQRAVGLVYYLGSYDERNAVNSGTSLPMKASGWFNVLSNGADGFDGGGGPECVQGSNEDDRIFTRGGSDYVRGKYGDDLILLGGGDDTADGGSDDDTIRGGKGNDRISGEQGSDCYDGGPGNDLLDDDHTSSTQIDEYMIDTTGGVDHITAKYPQMVDDCM